MKNLIFSKIKYAIYLFLLLSTTLSYSQYCPSNGNDTSDEYIGRVQLNSIDNLSGIGATSTGYSNFTGISTSLDTGSVYTITITPTWTSITYSEGYSVWIDYNQDDDFSDPGEQVWFQTTTTTSPVSGSFTVPATATTGNTRMRVSMKYNGIPTSCESFPFGEVEDYTINIINPSAPYCYSNGNSTVDEYIGRVQLGTIDNPSGAGATSTGYSNFTGISTNLDTGAGYTITVTPTWTSTTYNEGYSVWIDYNQDDDFNDAGEQVWFQAASTTSPVSGSFTVPGTATTGNTRMRVSMKWNGIPTSCESFDYGEVEDYTINIVDPPAPEINLVGNATSIASGDTTPIVGDHTEFGSIANSTTMDRTFTIQNTGTSTLNLTGGTPIVDISGNAAFSILMQPSANSISSSGDLTFVVRFAPTVAGSNLQATISIDNDDTTGGENPYTFVVQGSSLLTNSPGNVASNLQLWLRADQGIALTGTDVDSWADQSLNGFTGASQGTADAQYVATGLNFNPVLRFSGNSFYNLGNPSQLDLQPNTDEMTIITVVVTDGATTGTVFSKANNSTRNYQVWFGTTDRVLHHTLGRQGSSTAVRQGTIYALNEPKITTGVVSNTGNSLTRLLPYMNGVADPAFTNNGTSTGNFATDVLVGARRNATNIGSDYAYNGDIAEIIMYNRDLNATERQKVESYLAIKYGVTLGSNGALWNSGTGTTSPFGYTGTSNDYIASDGSILWNGSLNAGYGYHVFGIARDDDSNLLQQKSKSVNVIPEPILTMEAEAGSLNTDLSYLLVGNDGNNIALTTTGLPIRSTNILERVWKARESTNDSGTVTLEFDLSTSSITDAQGANLELLIADNASFNNYKNIAGTYNATTDVLTFTGINFEDEEFFTLSILEDFQNDYHLSFNGTSRYVDLGDHNDLTGNFTISAWIKSNTNNRTIISKGSAAGYEFSINNSGNLVMSFNSGTQTVTSTNSVPQNIWHYVAVIYNGTTAKIYIDGIEDGTANISTSPVANSENFLIGASGSSPSNFFSGEMDELRIWNRALTVDQLRFVMNQEIEISGGNVYGTIIPQTITKHETSSIPLGDLMAYYPFSHIRGNCLFNESSNTTQNGNLRNVSTSSIETQTTPLPFISNANTDWDLPTTWMNSGVQYIPNTTINGTKVDWNIVEINHDISVNRDLNILALLSNSNKLTVNGSTALNTGYGLTITHYLKLDGDIDLEGESQLIQTDGSDLDINSAGKLERDQQGTKDLYTYNYWSSPVGSIGAGSNNNSFILATDNILKNGTTSTPNNITFLTSGYNGSVSGSNISISDYWIWKYANQIGDNYYLWQHVRSTGSLSPGEGFTMKGVESSGSSFTSKQNYTFNGKPNNGDITLPLDPGNQYLVGNPYPSAIDADEFIKDNISTTEASGQNATGNVINGVLYFWEHFANNTHILKEYEGGYATYTLMGATPAISNDSRINASNQTSSTLPQQYIPIGQGFFVSSILDADLVGEASDPNLSDPIGVAGGQIVFKNSQRVFQKETPSTSVFLKTGNSKAKKSTSTETNTDIRQKIRLQFDSPKGYHRQLLVGVDENASNHFDIGYDAPLIETNKEDIFWVFLNNKFVIQAVDNFDTDQELPLGIKISQEGLTTIKIDKLENITNDLDVYIHDKELNVYHDLKQNDYEVYLTSGEHLERFEITFSNSNKSLGIDTIENNELQVYFSNEKKSIIVHNPILKHIKSIEINNILGQSVYEFSIETNKNYIEHNTLKITTGTYIIKMKTDEGTISKKVLVK